MKQDLDFKTVSIGFGLEFGMKLADWTWIWKPQIGWSLQLIRCTHFHWLRKKVFRISHPFKLAI